MRNKLIAVPALAVVLIAVVAAARIHTAMAEAAAAGPSGLALTIYNQNFAVVRQPINLNLQVGSNRIQFADTTAHLEPDSVILRDPSGVHSLRILEQNYRKHV